MAVRSKFLGWGDVETLGVDPEDGLLEFGLIVTDLDLKEVDRRSVVLDISGLPIDQIPDWPLIVHGSNGLLAECAHRGVSQSEAVEQILRFLEELELEPKTVPLAGASVHFDRAVLRYHMPEVESFFHYRNFDVSTIDAAVRMWRPEVEIPKGRGLHRALPDLEDSIAKARYFRELLFGGAGGE